MKQSNLKKEIEEEEKLYAERLYNDSIELEREEAEVVRKQLENSDKYRERLKKIEQEINERKITGIEDEMVDKYYSALKETAEKYGLEANVCDFDYERIYEKGYEDAEEWDIHYITSVEPSYEQIGENEDGDIICRLVVKIF